MIDEPDYDAGCESEDYCYGCRTAGCSGECRSHCWRPESKRGSGYPTELVDADLAERVTRGRRLMAHELEALKD